MERDILYSVKTPCYVIDEKKLISNLERLKYVKDNAGCHILLAQKAFSMYSLYPVIGKYLSGTAASGLYEARLGKEEMENGQVHVFSPAYKNEDIKELVKYADHIIFNSFNQWEKFKEEVKSSGREISCGLRINPGYSEVQTEIYNPCSEQSRLGIRYEEMEGKNLDGIEGLHFHALCEQGEDVLERTLSHAEKKFGRYFSQMKWVNFGGGHHITKDDYDVEALIRCINCFKEKYDVQVYLEPGEAIALNAGSLITEVIDINSPQGGISNVILDTSAACHMPDVLEMPYRPNVVSAGESGEKPYTFRLGGPTCLAGDVIGEYSFDEPLKCGDRLEFLDMAIYTMVKNNTFNGMPLPSIVLLTKEGNIKIIKEFGYEDFKMRV
ncbi:MAG: carboxynorspermidine decarboxylase [Lachnospiraceae bacterium]|nr:carboxynorspermidine decarboxylase [Lachnospiraceae bacterium]